jgi:hypothetical protein
VHRVIGSNCRAFSELSGHAAGSNEWQVLGGGVRFQRAFQINYAESYESAECRFHPWLEESLVNALTLWRKASDLVLAAISAYQ